MQKQKFFENFFKKSQKNPEKIFFSIFTKPLFQEKSVENPIHADVKLILYSLCHALKLELDLENVPDEVPTPLKFLGEDSEDVKDSGDVKIEKEQDSKSEDVKDSEVTNEDVKDSGDVKTEKELDFGSEDVKPSEATNEDVKNSEASDAPEDIKPST